MGFDIRTPIGLLFIVLAALLLACGYWTDPAIYVRSLGYNINQIWGGVMMVFGIAMLCLARRTNRKGRRSPQKEGK